MPYESVSVTPGSGVDVAVDRVSGQDLQAVKIDIGADGASSGPAGGASTPFRVDPTGSTTQPVSASALPLPTGAASAANQTTIIGHLDGVEAALSAIQTAVELLDNIVSGSEAQVDVLTVPADPFGANADAVVAAGAAGSIQAKLRRLTSDLDAVKTAVETLDNTVSGSELQVDIVSSALPTGAASAANQSTIIGHLDGVETALTAIQTAVQILDNIVSGNEAQVDVLTVPSDPFGANADAAATAGSTGSIQAKLRLMTSQLDAIKTAVETLDNTVGGSELQVDIVSSALPTGAATVANQTTMIGHLDGVETLLTAIQTAVQIIDNSISGSETQVDVVASLPAGDNNIGNVDLASAIPAGTNNIGDVDVATIAAGENHIGQVGTPGTTITVTPTINTAIYAAGDAVGGKQTLTNICRVSGGDVLLTDILIIDESNQKAAFEIVFFESDPSAATITNNAAFAFSTDIAKVIHRQSVAAVDYATIDGEAIAVVPNINVLLTADGSDDLYVAVITTGTPTYGATDDLTFLYKVIQL